VNRGPRKWRDEGRRRRSVDKVVNGTGGLGRPGGGK